VNNGRERVVNTCDITIGDKSSDSLVSSDDDGSASTPTPSMTRNSGIGGVRRCLKLIDDDRKPLVHQRLITDMFAALSLGDKDKSGSREGKSS
jgi:hypothetical protein